MRKTEAKDGAGPCSLGKVPRGGGCPVLLSELVLHSTRNGPAYFPSPPTTNNVNAAWRQHRRRIAWLQSVHMHRKNFDASSVLALHDNLQPCCLPACMAVSIMGPQ